MAVYDSSALNLVDYAKMSNDPRVLGMAWSLVNHNAILQDIPWKTARTLKAVGSRWESLPGTNWVKLNEQLTTQDGSPVQHSENVYFMRDLIKTDDALRNDDNAIEDPHIARINAYLKSRSYAFNDSFINNDPANGGDEDAITGLKGRLDNPNTYKVLSGNKIDADGTFTSGATAAQYLGVLEAMDDMLDAVDDLEGNSTVIYCNRAFLKRFSQLSRLHSGVGGFGRGEDQYDRFTFKYRGAMLRDTGVKQDQSTQIITSTETDAGVSTGGTNTSLYAVNYSQFHGIMGSMRALNLELEDGVLHRTMLEMSCGLFPVTNRCISRLYNIDLG